MLQVGKICPDCLWFIACDIAATVVPAHECPGFPKPYGGAVATIEDRLESIERKLDWLIAAEVERRILTPRKDGEKR